MGKSYLVLIQVAHNENCIDTTERQASKVEGEFYFTVALIGLRSQVGSPITHAHKNRATDDVSYGDRKQVPPKEIDPAEDIRINSRNVRNPAPSSTIFP